MRAGVPLLLLSGCLAAPPSGEPSAPDAGTGAADAADAAAASCVHGSTLDLVYVDRISYPAPGSGQVILNGGAVFINSGIDTIVLPGFLATAGNLAPSILALASIGGAEGGLILLPGEAKGALSQGAAAVVRPAFAENWVDEGQPILSESFTIDDAAPEAEDSSFAIPLQVTAGDYTFDLVVTLAQDESKLIGTPLTAARATATCN
jgi:hypothetical protein